MGDQRLYPCYALGEHAHSGYSFGNLLQHATNGLQLRLFSPSFFLTLAADAVSSFPSATASWRASRGFMSRSDSAIAFCKYSRSAGDVIRLRRL